MKMIPYLNFSGDCRDAFDFYAQVFNGKIEAMKSHRESPFHEQMSPDWHQKIWHAHMRIGEVELMASDVPPSMYTKPQGFAVTVQLAGAAEAERTFATLEKGGTVTVPLQENYFGSARFGIVTDRFGTPWIVTCVPDA